ncbi:hypothetical protein EVAR_100665_1 [Eumeta japonica]|uniref:Uncharacterized protein n=1 Tax=Eumeta variegata TaxID=151549 RepID=A0A4C1SGR6_EUMVA|nr:hypothetical protein EVAR_100665_1 [Eumeta japonica]
MKGLNAGRTALRFLNLSQWVLRDKRFAVKITVINHRAQRHRPAHRKSHKIRQDKLSIDTTNPRSGLINMRAEGCYARATSRSEDSPTLRDMERVTCGQKLVKLTVGGIDPGTFRL